MKRGIMDIMRKDDDSAKLVPPDAGEELDPALALPPAALQAFENLVPLLVEPETLLQGLRFLQRRIPGFEHLTVAEERSMAKAAHLPREIVERGLDAADVWEDPKGLFGWTAEEQRREDEAIRGWDGVHRELLILAKGVYGANLRRKHRRGSALMTMYFVGRRISKRDDAVANRLRPYIEEMRKGFVKQRRKKKA